MIPIAWMPGPTETIVIVLLIVLLFGIKKLPELGKSLAEGIHEFKKAKRTIAEEDESEVPAKKTD